MNNSSKKQELIMADKEEQYTDVNKLGEFGLIEHLTKSFKPRRKSTIKGVGDDAAVLAGTDEYFLLATDFLVEGIHFDVMYTPLKHLGYKSVVVNLSDIYAMNGRPTHITVSIALSNRFTVEAMEELYKGVQAACDKYRVDLIGGDTGSAPKGLFISVTAVGSVHTDQVVYRSGAKPGDLICVSGDLGAAYLGLQLLEREKQLYLDNPDVQPKLTGNDYIIERQLKPEARFDIIDQFTEEHILPTAMIDISDGLASDLLHICKESGCGAVIEEGKVPIKTDAEKKAIEFNLDPITAVLNGGEDYELLFTVNPKDLETVRYLTDVAIIGEVLEDPDEIFLLTAGEKKHPIKAQGWQHFRDDK